MIISGEPAGAQQWGRTCTVHVTPATWGGQVVCTHTVRRTEVAKGVWVWSCEDPEGLGGSCSLPLSHTSNEVYYITYWSNPGLPAPGNDSVRLDAKAVWFARQIWWEQETVWDMDTRTHTYTDGGTNPCKTLDFASQFSGGLQCVWETRMTGVRVSSMLPMELYQKQQQQ